MKDNINFSRQMSEEEIKENFPSFWWKIKDKIMPSDELREFHSSPESWANLAGRGGIVLVRDGEIVDSMITIMN